MKPFVGYASVYYNAQDPTGTTYQLGEGYIERIMPGAFDRAIREKQDVRALVNHNPDFLLGRTASGTLKLKSDSKGLHYTVTPASTQTAKDTEELLRRGDMSGSSFGFVPRKVGHTEEKGFVYRDIFDVDLMDVSAVCYPAYPGTTASLGESRSAGGRSYRFVEYRSIERATGTPHRRHLSPDELRRLIQRDLSITQSHAAEIEEECALAERSNSEIDKRCAVVNADHWLREIENSGEVLRRLAKRKGIRL